MADQLATPSDLASYVQSDVDTASATLAIEVATGTIQAVTGQRLVAVTNETVTLSGSSWSVWLPEAPVTALGAVTTQETYSGVSSTRTLGTHFYRVGDQQLVWGTSPTWWPGLPWPPFVTVTYSHGYALVPQALRGVCLSLASRYYSQTMQGLRSLTVGGITEQYDPGVGGGLTDLERAALAPFSALVVA